MISTILVMMCVTTVNPVDAAIAEANRAQYASDYYPGRTEDLKAGFQAVRTLRDLAKNCPEEDWPTMRVKLIDGLDHENRNVWLACFSALTHREGEAGADVFFEQIDYSTDPARVEIATRAVSRLARQSSQSFRDQAVGHLSAAIRDYTRRIDRGTIVAAIGSLGEIGTFELNELRNDPFLGPRIRDQLPFAYAATGDPNAITPLLELLQAEPAPGRPSTACVLAVGHLIREIQRNGLDQNEPARSDIEQAVTLLRNFLIPNAASEPETAATAVLALSRAGFFWDDTPSKEQAWELLESPTSQATILRVIFENKGQDVPAETVTYIRSLVAPAPAPKTMMAMTMDVGDPDPAEPQAIYLAEEIVGMWEEVHSPE